MYCLDSHTKKEKEKSNVIMNTFFYRLKTCSIELSEQNQTRRSQTKPKPGEIGFEYINQGKTLNVAVTANIKTPPPTFCGFGFSSKKSVTRVNIQFNPKLVLCILRALFSGGRAVAN